MFFAILPEQVVFNQNLKDREIRVLAGLLCNYYKSGGGTIEIKQLAKLLGKSKKTIIRAITNLKKAGILKVKKRGKRNIYIFTFEFQGEFNLIDADFLNEREKRKIWQIAKENNLNNDEFLKLIEILRQRQGKIKNMIRYFSYIVKNRSKILNQGDEQIEITNVSDFYGFQTFLNNNKVVYKFEVIEKPKYFNNYPIGGKWVFKGKNIKKMWRLYNAGGI